MNRKQKTGQKERKVMIKYYLVSRRLNGPEPHFSTNGQREML